MAAEENLHCKGEGAYVGTLRKGLGALSFQHGRVGFPQTGTMAAERSHNLVAEALRDGTAARLLDRSLRGGDH